EGPPRNLRGGLFHSRVGGQAARILATNAWISVVRPSQRVERSLAEARALAAAVPVSPMMRESPPTLVATPDEPVAASSALRAISCVAAPCSSTAAATELVMPLIPRMVP